MAIVSSGSITILDLNDARQLLSYIGSSQSKTVIYTPDNNAYVPNFNDNNQILMPQLFIAGSSMNLISEAKSVKWFYQINSFGNLIEITENNSTYEIDEEKNLIIKTNVLQNNRTVNYICEIIYEDEGILFPTKSEIEIVKVSNGQKGQDGRTPVKGVDYFDGEDGQDGRSSYLWVRYSQNSTGSGMTTNPSNAKYIGMASTESSTAPSSPSMYNWTLIKGNDGVAGETGSDGRTSYLHIKYSNDEGRTFTGNEGEDVGIWIGMYVDFIQQDSIDTSKYTWNKVQGNDAIFASIWTPQGNTIKNSEGSLQANIRLFEGSDLATPSNFKWYIQDPTATTSNGGDSDGGNGWRRLTSSYNLGTSGYNTDTLIIPARAVTSLESFKCVVTFSDKKYQDVCTIIDISDPYTISIMGVNTFKNGQGSTQMTARVYRNGEEEDLNGTKFKYEWSLYKSNGERDTRFSKIGKTINVFADEVDARANLICSVSEL